MMPQANRIPVELNVVVFLLRVLVQTRMTIDKGRFEDDAAVLGPHTNDAATEAVAVQDLHGKLPTVLNNYAPYFSRDHHRRERSNRNVVSSDAPSTRTRCRDFEGSTYLFLFPYPVAAV
jgi:hypothetical protein